jgi:Leucine-rich repeat (LRR) protein
MTNMRILIIENNRIESLPAELSQLNYLLQIRANNNRMTTVPPVLKTMTLLDVLDLSGNNIPSKEIDELKSQLPNTQIKP